MWVTTQSFRWRPVSRREFPDRLVEAVGEQNLPGLDVFVCTADPKKEPPVGVASTALSAMAFDYPAGRVSVYVSDDGGSELTLFAFMEAAKFARHWLPFCREKRVRQRSPEAFFGSDEGEGFDEMKMMYETMKEKVETVVETGFVSEIFLESEEDLELFKKWKGYTRRNHPSIIKVLLDGSKDTDLNGNPMPNLVYVSREKIATVPHNFKAGALNTLVRVSGIMSDAQVLLTLDCDMYSNDPRSPYRALCYMMDPAIASRVSFVQFPQRYKGLNRNDIYAGEMKHLFIINARGMDGLEGPNYVGTCCYHSRRSFYGPPSSSLQTLESYKFRERGSFYLSCEETLKEAHRVASSSYEIGTKWGSMIGFRYGSLVEDFYTGYRLHCEGWSSVYCNPETPAFLGDSPKNLSDSLGQVMRWTEGLYEVVFSKYSPLTFGTRRASFLMGLCYTHYSFWGSWGVSLPTYAIVPQLALAFGIPLFPKLSDPWFYLYAYLFLSAYCQDLVGFLKSKGTVQRWWNDQRMWMIRGLTSRLFGTAQYVMKQLGISAGDFNITSKVMDTNQSKRYDNELFEFGMVSPFFFAIGTVSIINLASLAIGIIRVATKIASFNESFVQIFLAGFGVLNCWPVYVAMLWRKDEGRMPIRVTNISVLVTLLMFLIGHFVFAE